MSTIHPSGDGEAQLSPARRGQPARLRVVQTLSRLVTAIFIVALVWAIYESVVNGNPLPAWAWIGGLALLAAVAGLGVAIVVYQGVAREIGPFDFSSVTRVAGDMQSESRQVEAGGASALRADIRMTQGVLQLQGGATALMEAAFTYDDADWKPPAVEYTVSDGGQGNLLVKQRATNRPAMHQGPAEWQIRLHPDLPTDLDVRFGAGRADLRLGGLKLTGLRVESGVGDLDLDFGGDWAQSLEAFVKAGIGDTLLRLPQKAGVRVHSTVGLGSLRAPDLDWDGEAYTNALYGRAPVNLEITIQGGVGKITLEQAADDRS